MNRAFVLFVTFFTGAAGLIYEVSWQRYLANIVGSEARSICLVLAVFLGGLSVGYYLFGRISKNLNPSQLIKICGYTEIGIGAWAILFPKLYGIVWDFVKISHSTALLFDLGLCIALIGVPTILMGGTLPLLTQGLSKDLNDSAKFHARLYAVNTGGAFLGALLAGFILLPNLGLPPTVIGTSVINIVVGLILILLSKSSSSASISDRVDLNISKDKISLIKFSRALIIAFLSGFYSISIQSVIVRIFGISAGASEYSFSMVVSSFVLMLAVGSYYAGNTQNARRSLFINQNIILISLCGLYFLIPYWPYGVHVVRTLFSAASPNFYIFHITLFILLSLILIIPIGAIGRTLPLVFATLREQMGNLGSVVGKVYGINTIGCVLGAVLGGYVALYYFDLDVLFRVSIVLTYLTVLASLPFGTFKLSKSNSVIATFSVIVFILTIPAAWQKEYFSLGSARMRQSKPYSYQGADVFYKTILNRHTLLAHKDDPNTSVSVVEIKSPSNPANATDSNLSRTIYVNGKPDGSTMGGDLVTTRLLGHLPALFRKANTGKVAVIGYGTGITIGSLSLYPDISEIDCMEISPFVRKFAEYFDFANYNASKSPKLKWHMGDAYRTLGANSDQYDLIVSEPSNPWVTGVERVYTREFYDLGRSKLVNGGIYAQWFHTYDMDQETLGIVVNNFIKSFPFARLFEFGADMVLLGSEENMAIASLDNMMSRLDNALLREDLSGINISSVEELLSLELPLPRELFQPFGYHSLEFPVLAFRAGKDHFFGISSSIMEFLNKDFNYASALRAQKNLLLGMWLKKYGKNNSILTLGKGLCVSNLETPLPNWRSLNKECRRILMTLAVNGELEKWQALIDPEARIVKALAEPKQSTNLSKDIAQSKQTLQLFMEYNFYLLPLNPARLIQETSPCDDFTVQGIECRGLLIEVLAKTDNMILAQSEFNRLKSKNPKAFLNLHEGRLRKLANLSSDK